MINTDSLKEGDIIEVSFENKSHAKCKFINGVFQNIENNSNKNEVYGSSVVSYIKLEILDKDSPYTGKQHLGGKDAN